MVRGVVLAADGSSDVWPGHGLPTASLVPLANRPILAHALESLRCAGVEDATVIVDATSHKAIRGALNGNGAAHVLPCVTADGGAVSAGLQAVVNGGDGPLVLLTADAFYRDPVARLLERLDEEHLDAVAVRPPDMPDDGDEPVVTVVRCATLRDALERVPGARGVRGILEAAAAGGQRVIVEASPAAWRWSGEAEGLLEGNRILLDRLEGSAPAEHARSAIQGRVSIHPTAQIEDSVIRGPAIVGARAIVRHAYIGPYTSIGSDVTVDGAEIEHSVVLGGASIEHVGRRLESSVVGSGARIYRSFELPAALRLHLGARSEISLA